MPKLQNRQHEEFCLHYMSLFNATKAAIEAGYSKKTARQQGARLLTNVVIQERVAELGEVVAQRLEIDQDAVFRRWWDTANADPNELTQMRRGPCRYCHGKGGLYQWKSLREFNEAYDQWQIEAPTDTAAANVIKSHAIKEPKGDGGFGYRITDEPNADCAECSGLGFSYVYLPDSRNLSPQAKLLYEGAKETKNGIEVHMADRAKNLEMVARKLGMLKDDVKVDLSDRLSSLVERINAKGSTAPIKEQSQ